MKEGQYHPKPLSHSAFQCNGDHIFFTITRCSLISYQQFMMGTLKRFVEHSLTILSDGPYLHDSNAHVIGLHYIQ